MDSNLTNSEIERDLKKRLGIGMPSSRTSQENVNRNANAQHQIEYAGRGNDRDHFRRGEASEHARRRQEPVTPSYGSPRGQRSWWDQQPPTTGSSPRAHNYSRNSYYSRSPKNWHEPLHEFGPTYGPQRDGRATEHSGSNFHRPRAGVQEKTKDTPIEGKGVLAIDSIAGGGENEVQAVIGDQDEDNNEPNKKGAKRRVRKKKRDKKGLSGIDDSFEKLEATDSENKSSIVIPLVPNQDTEEKMKQDDKLNLTKPASMESCVDARTSQAKHAASAQMAKRAMSALAKQPGAAPLIKSELSITNHESWPELGNEVPIKNNKTALKQKAENEVAENKSKPTVPNAQEENRPPADVLERLAKDCIYPLKKRHSKFPKAMFFCHLCEYHCDTVPICNRHVKESRHLKNKRIRELEITLRNLPAPTESHIEVLTDLLLNVHEQFALTDEELKVRQQFVKNLNAKVRKKLPCCEIRLYGSSLSGIGMKGADVNIDLVVSDKENPAKTLMTVFEILKTNGDLANVESDFGAKIPAIHFLEKKHSLNCVVSLNNLTSYKTTCLLTEYAKIDPRVHILGVLFRHWAKLCMIDRQNMGTLPSYSYSLMLVYFLQQHDPPVLPVLHEMVKQPNDEYLSAEEACKQWQTSNKQSVGALWVDLFKFFSVSYKMTDFVISLRQQKPVTRNEKNWSSKKIALEDPYSPKRNLARFISNQILFDYILERFKMTYKYFGIPQTTKGPLFSKLSSLEEECENQSDNKMDSSRTNFLEVLDTIAKRAKEAKQKKKDSVSNAKIDDDEDVLVLSLSELKKMNKMMMVNSPASTNDRTTGTDDVCANDVTTTDIAVTTPKRESKSAKNGKNLATKKDIDGQQQEHAKSKNRTNSVQSCDSPKNTQKEDDILSPFLTTSSQDDGDSEDISEISPHGIDDDSEQESCIPASLMEALDDDLDASSLSGAEGSDTLISLVTNHNEVVNGDLTEDVQVLEINGNQSQVNTVRADPDGKMGARSSSRKSGGQGTSACDGVIDKESDDISLKPAPLINEVDTSATDSSEKAKDQTNSKEDNGTSPKTKRLKTPKISEALLEQINSLQKEDFCFRFKDLEFTGGKKPSVFCSVCQKEGHLKQDCPEEKLPELLPLPRMEHGFMRAIDKASREIYIENCPRDYETAERIDILRDLQGFIQYHLYKDARLELFGSSCNGFGFAHSDMDICLTFASNKTGEDLKCVPIIENLTEKLKKHKILYNVIPITTAKVPIVKFTHRPSRLEGDISLYNTLAQHNTRMLALYSILDERVKVLGYTMKYFAKCCDIGDASRGSLSSYAYILMVIYFLQQRQPPVIPVLQEMYDKTKPAPTRIVDGWNAWFLEDGKKVQKMWPYFGNNQESIGELWLGLLCFYTEEFNFRDSVISIRQHKILTRFEKLWNSKCIAIEDPFDLQHNLGAGVSRKMNSYIMKAFIKGRVLFGTPLTRIPYPYRTLKDYLFCPDELTDGAPPNDRGCRLCGKIGHMVKDCPRKRPHNRDRENAGKEQKKEQPRDNAQAQSNELSKGQGKVPHRDQTRESQRPSREKKAEPSFIEKMLVAPGHGFPLPNSLQFNNSMLPNQSSRNVLPTHPLLNIPFNRNGPMLRAGLHNGQFAPNMPVLQQSPQLTALRLTPSHPSVAHNIKQDETTANNRTKASSSMPNLTVPCVVPSTLAQPTSKPLSLPVENVLSASKGMTNSLVQNSMHHHALPNSETTTTDLPPPMQYSKSDSQVSSTLRSQEISAEQLHHLPLTERSHPKANSAARSRNVIVAQSLTKLSNPSESSGQLNARDIKVKSGFDTSEQLLTKNTDVTPNLANFNDSLSTLTCSGSDIPAKLKDGSMMGNATPHFISELMKDRPTIGNPTTVFTTETVKESLASSNIQSSEKVRLMNAQNLRTSSNAVNINKFSSPQPSADSVPTSFGGPVPLTQHPPAPPGFMNINYRMPFPQRNFSAEGTAPFTTLQESVPRGRGHPPPPPPGIPVGTSFSPVYVAASENGTSVASRQSNSAQQYPGNIHPQITQPSQQFTQFPGLFHAYPNPYFSMGLSSYPVSAYSQLSSQQQQQQHAAQKIPSSQPSLAPSPQLILQDHPSCNPLIARTCAEAIPISTSETRSIVTQESSPLPTHHLGNQFLSSHERPSENILLNAMGIVRPSSTHDNQWLQLTIAGSAHSQALSDTSHPSERSSSGPLHHGTPLNFKGNDSD